MFTKRDTVFTFLRKTGLVANVFYDSCESFEKKLSWSSIASVN